MLLTNFKVQCRFSRRRSRRKAQVRNDIEYEKLKACMVQKVSTKQTLPLASVWQGGLEQRSVICFLTHFGDLTTWEYGKKLLQDLSLFEEAKVEVVVVGLGSIENAIAFNKFVPIPLDNLFVDETGQAYEKMQFSKGFAPDMDINPYLKLLPMLMGIGSPGTIEEVLRGYTGDGNAPQVFTQETPFDILGQQYQRPFELATLRLQNMIGVLQNWSQLAPQNSTLLTYQGGTLVFEGEKCIWKHVDSGILKYANFETLKQQALLLNPTFV